jgi:hypothetical protein
MSFASHHSHYPSRGPLLCGAPVAVEVTLGRDGPAAAPRVAVGFDDTLGCRVFTAATYLTDTAPAELRRKGRLLCRLGELPLAPGRYCLTLNAGPQGAQWTDVFDQVLWFEVTASDFYGNGKLSNPAWGRALIRSRWEGAAV